MPLGLLKAGLRRSAPTRFLPGYARAPQALRRRHHRRRRPRAGHRVLPRERSRHPQRRRPGKGLPRRRQHRRATPRSSAPTTSRRRACAFYEESVELFAGLSRRARFQPLLFRARPLHARAHRRRAADACAGAPRSTSISASTAELIGARRDQAPRARRSTCSADVTLADRSARFTTRRARSFATTRWPGAMPRGATRRGVEIHQQTEVTGIEVEDGAGGRRPHGPRARPRGHVLQAVAGSSTRVAEHGRLPRCRSGSIPLQACVSRAAQAVPRPDHRVGQPAHLCQPVVARRAGDRRRRRSRMRSISLALDAGLHRGSVRPHARAVSLPGRGESAAAVGGNCRHDAGLRPIMGTDAGRELLHRRRLGHLGIQGDAGLRQAAWRRPSRPASRPT